LVQHTQEQPLTYSVSQFAHGIKPTSTNISGQRLLCPMANTKDILY